MVSVKDALGGFPLSAASSASTSTLGSSSSSSASSSTTTQFLNVLTSGGSSGPELTQVQHYNDLQYPKHVNMKTVKDVNVKRGHDSSGLIPDIWKTPTVRDYTHRKLSHQGTIRESDFYKETSLERNQIETERNINLNVEPEGVHHCSRSNEEKTIYDINCKIQNTEVITNVVPKGQNEGPVAHPKLGKTRSWWRGKLPLRASISNSSQSSSSVIPGSLKRTRFWNSLSRTLELPDKLRREDKILKKVPKLQIWLSTDSRGTELSDISEPSVLNNSRGAVPRIQLEQPKVINRSLIDNARWRALSEGSSPTVQEGRSNVDGRNLVNSGPKSPVEKQPTWPVCYLLQPRPKLIHQTCLNTQNVWNHEFLNKRLGLPRQKAVSDEVDSKEIDSSKSTETQHEWKRGSFSTESQASTSVLSAANFGDSKWSLRPRLSTGGQTKLGMNLFFGRRGASSTSRSYSDEKSEIYDGNLDVGPNAAPSFNSVFSLTDPPSTPSLSWASSHASLHSDFPSGLHVDGPETRRDRSSSFNHDLLSPNPVTHAPCTRSLSAASASIFSFSDKSQFKLTIPGSEGGRSRRPSLLSLRSMGRSPIPYVSMDYDYDSDYEYIHGGAHSGLIPEAAPKLSFTQKLAFPTLYQNSIDRPKPRDPYTEADNNMNTVAKIITVVILTFVTVFILGGLFKLLH